MDGLRSLSPLLIFENDIFPVLIAAVVLMAATGAGMTLFKLAAPGRRATAFEWTLGPALGFAALGYAADLVFITERLPMRPVYAACVLVGVVLFVWQARSLTLSRPRLDAPWPDRAFWFAGWAVVAWFAVKLFVGNVTPVNDNDSIYHYTFYSRLLSSGATFDQILLLRNFPVTDLNRIIQHVYALAGTLGGDGALHMVNFLFIAGIALVAQSLCAEVLRVTRWANPLPILAVITLRELIHTGFSAKLDYGVALCELAALSLFLTWRDRRTWMPALALGMTLCARTNSLRLVAVIPLIWMVDQLLNRAADGGLRRILTRTLAVGAGTVAIAAPPYAMQQYIYGNPFFPMFNDIFGAYRHYYDWIILETLRYRTDYGWLGAPAVYLSVALKGLFTVPGVVTPPNTPWGLSVLMLLAPLAIRRDRYVLGMLGFVILGYVTWYTQSNTIRTLLSVAVVAVILAAAVITALRARAPVLYFALFAGVITLAGWTAYDFLGLNSLVRNYYYVVGHWSEDEYHDNMVRPLYPDVPNVADVAAISGIVGGESLASINLTPFAHPRLVRTRRLMIPAPGVTMATMAADERADPEDRRIAQELLNSSFLARQARDVAARLWPTVGRQRPLEGGLDLRWYLTASHDASRHLSELIAEDPARLAPMLRFERVGFVLAGASSVYGSRSVDGLTEVWRSEEFVLLRVGPG